MADQVDVAKVLVGLTDFQLRTVQHVHELMYGAAARPRFLVADEVGLGKTRVALGIIAKVAAEKLRQQGRASIVYVCNSQEIADQNLRRLNRGLGIDVRQPKATRLTLLPLELADQQRGALSVVALTPGTSFETDGLGHADERRLLHVLADEAWEFRANGMWAKSVNTFRGTSKHFEAHVDSLREQLRSGALRLDGVVQRSFVAALKRSTALRNEFFEIAQHFSQARSEPAPEIKRQRRLFIGKMRKLLAEHSLRALQPDLIVLDEFQRFRDLLRSDDPTDLASRLLDYASKHGDARTLLLSATPYRPLTMHHERDDSDHYVDLLHTLRFLSPEEETPWAALFQAYQEALTKPLPAGEERAPRLRAARDAVQLALRGVMVRMERGDDTPMLREVPWPANEIEPDDLRAAMGLMAIAKELEQGDAVEYWKSAPYVLNFMESYLLKQRFITACEETKRAEMRRLVQAHPALFMDTSLVQSWQPLPLRNARVRRLMAEVDKGESWRLLWLPPSAPCYALAGAFAHPEVASLTKSLIFSAWHVVPRSVPAMVSYEVERRLHDQADGFGGETYHSRPTRLLRFSRSSGRLDGLPLLTWIYASPTLARLGDPVTLRCATLEAAMAVVKQRLSEALKPLRVQHEVTSGAEDDRWYWRALRWLDRGDARAQGFWCMPKLASEWRGHEHSDDESRDEAWEEHVRLWQRDDAPLGREPHDLLDVLALTAIAGPAVAALRALERGAEETQFCTLLHAGRVGQAFVSHFNQRDAAMAVRGLLPGEPYWRRALEYAAQGCLQSVLDEFVHLLRDDADKAMDIADAMIDTLTLRTAPLRADRISAPEGKLKVRINPKEDDTDEVEGARGVGLGIRVRYAMRYGDERREDVSIEPQAKHQGSRKRRVQQAFNSPFWPFMLVTTSVGQEGLDFHRYCHRVIHWNLPSNPVDLEQREGRVHRYKGHAQRRNLAARYATQLSATEVDMWHAMFAKAKAERGPKQCDLHPYWLMAGPASIERCVPAMPLSREHPKLMRLREELVLYRLAFGHPRQEDVINYLRQHAAEVSEEDLLIDLRVPMATSAV